MCICEGGKSGKGLAESSKLPKPAQPVRAGKRERDGRGKNVRKETANEACFNSGSMEMEEKILRELMISVHRQTPEDRLWEQIPSCVGRIERWPLQPRGGC